jgi:ABC-2 type transport system ATP-binding protein
MMIQKTVECPHCHQVLTCTGTPGEMKKITCPKCNTPGKVTFQAIPVSKEIAIEVSHLQKIYGSVAAVDDISFSVKKGEVFAFLGPNGAGKTTTVEIIESIREPTGGSVKIFGRDIKSHFNAMKKYIGVLPQEFHSFERLTVRETLEYFSKLYDKRADIDEIIASMELREYRDKLYQNLSGGLKQRVGVAISLVNDPQIVFLDEPSTGLDPRARREVWNVIAGLREKRKTVFLTTHYMEEAEYLADHIAIIHRGKIIAEGSLDELINKYGRGNILRINKCEHSNVVELLRTRGFAASYESNGDIAVRIDTNDRILEILSWLRHECIDYGSIDIRRSNLEEVFLYLTGSKLSEGDT